MQPAVNVRLADLDSEADAAEILLLLQHYAEHPMGAGGNLPQAVEERVIDGLRQHPTTRVFLAEAAPGNGGADGGNTGSEGHALGMATSFVGFSTFKAKPLINIHDLVVHASVRGQGIGGALLDAVTRYAREQNFCAVTLEVLASNPARKLYQKKGFRELEEPTQGTTTLFGKLPL